MMLVTVHVLWAQHILFIAAIVLLARQSNCLRCEFYNSKSKINTTIPGPPVMTELKTNVTIFKPLYTGKFLRLQCCTTGNPLPLVTWYKDDQKLDLTNFRYKLMSNNQSLWMQSIKLTDAGLYCCQASNIYGKQYRRFKVKVTMSTVLQKPVVILKPHSWSVLVGSNATLTCIVKKSALKPMILWQYNSTKTRPLQRYTGRHLVQNTKMNEDETWCSNLTIFNVTEDDEGVYFCKAINGAGSGKASQDSGVLSVNVPKSMKSLPPKNALSAGDDSEYRMLTIVGLVITTTIVTMAIVIAAVWRYKRKRAGDSGQVSDDAYLHTDATHELHKLVNPDGTNPYEIPPKNLELLQRQAGEKPFDFDVFISYSSQDRDFVKKVLFNELSTTHSVCIDFKDFEAGVYIGENIYNCIVQSRKTLLVVSKNFLSGVWTFFEMQIAQGRLAQGHDVLIPVIIEDISYNELPKPLQHYRKTKTYLEYFNEDVQPHFWGRLRSAIGKSLEQEKMLVEVPENDDNDNDKKENDNLVKDNVHV